MQRDTRSYVNQQTTRPYLVNKRAGFCLYMCILIVDDEPDIRWLISELLIDEGYTVAQAADGREALAYLQDATPLPCVIILDLMMPIMNGWDFLQVQQHNPRLASIPIVVVSAARTAINVNGLGVQEALDKPFDMDRLLATIQRYCPSAPPYERDSAASVKGAR
jgi:CheY-like chemotaxis protein